MKTKLLFMLATIFSVALYSQTPVPAGNIGGTWTLAGSPYHILGETTIPDGQTLTIEPGVRVEWQGSYTMWVQGKILAQGTETDSITFTAADTAAGWRSIRFNNTPGTNDTSRFKYCVFRYGKVYGNWPDNCGGAIAALGFNKLLIDHCLFDRNDATDVSLYPIPSGGAIALDNSSPVIRNSRFSNNLSVAGGAIICSESNPSIDNNEFTGNIALDPSGGFVWGQGFGGAICVYLLSDPTVSQNTFFGNTAERSGGAIGCNSQCHPQISHNLIYNNTAYVLGGAIEVEDTCSPVLINNTIADNQAEFGGGIDVWHNCNPEIRNTILWNNSASAGNEVNINDPTCVPGFYYCDIQGGQAAFGGFPHTGAYDDCIDADPEFYDPENGEYRLTTDISPCINKGDPDPVYNDPDGSRNDMGALWPPRPWVGIYEKEVDNVFVYPNPVHSEAIVEYNLEQPADIRIMLIDQPGQVIRDIHIGNRPAGKQKISIDVSALPKGIYFIRLQNGNEIVTRKMIRQ